MQLAMPASKYLCKEEGARPSRVVVCSVNNVNNRCEQYISEAPLRYSDKKIEHNSTKHTLLYCDPNRVGSQARGMVGWFISYSGETKHPYTLMSLF